jgi:hypothetical protein
MEGWRCPYHRRKRREKPERSESSREQTVPIQANTLEAKRDTAYEVRLSRWSTGARLKHFAKKCRSGKKSPQELVDHLIREKL